MQYNDGECSWFPELWIHECCVLHDKGVGDKVFFQCIVDESSFLGPFGILFAVLIVTGMCIGRPLYHFITRKKMDK